MYVVDSELTDTDTHLTFVRVHALDIPGDSGHVVSGRYKEVKVFLEVEVREPGQQDILVLIQPDIN